MRPSLKAPANGAPGRCRSKRGAHRPDFATALRSNPQPRADLRIRQPAVSSLTHAYPGEFIISVPPQMVIDLIRVCPYSVHCRLSITCCLWTTGCTFALILCRMAEDGCSEMAALDRNCRQTVSYSDELLSEHLIGWCLRDGTTEKRWRI